MTNSREYLIFPDSRGRLAVLLAGLAVLLSIMSLLANVAWIEHWPGAGTVLALFSVDREMSVPTWWSAFVLAGLGVVAWALAGSQPTRSRLDRLGWWSLAGGLMFLSADEICMLHERLGGKIQVEGLMYHARWILVWLLPAIIAVVGVFVCLWRLHRHVVIGMTLGILVYLAGAVGMETANAAMRYDIEQRLQAPAEHTVDAHQSFVPLDWRRDRSYYPYVIGTTIEELLEMLGPVIWAWVLLDPRNRPREDHTSTGGDG